MSSEKSDKKVTHEVVLSTGRKVDINIRHCPQEIKLHSGEVITVPGTKVELTTETGTFDGRSCCKAPGPVCENAGASRGGDSGDRQVRFHPQGAGGHLEARDPGAFRQNATTKGEKGSQGEEKSSGWQGVDEILTNRSF